MVDLPNNQDARPVARRNVVLWAAISMDYHTDNIWREHWKLWLCGSHKCAGRQ